MADSGLRAAELLRSAGDLWTLADALWASQFGLLFLGRFDEVAEIGEELEPLASRLGHLGALVMAGRARGLREFMLTGDIDKYEEFARADLELARSTGFGWLSVSYTMLGLADFRRGRWQEALEKFQEAVRLETAGFWASGDWAFLFLGKAHAGDRDAALAMLEERRDNLPRPSQANTNGAWTMLFGVVEGLAVLDERDEAAKLYPLVLEAIDTGALLRLWAYGLLQTVAGMAAAAGRQWEKAEEHYQTALRQAHELPVVIEQPEVRRWYARMLIDRDAPGDPSTGSARDRDRARELLTEAIAMYRRIGMPKHVGMAQALLSQL
jgi:tetratricopeptide (TPR) repeat protein